MAVILSNLLYYYISLMNHKAWRSLSRDNREQNILPKVLNIRLFCLSLQANNDNYDNNRTKNVYRIGSRLAECGDAGKRFSLREETYPSFKKSKSITVWLFKKNGRCHAICEDFICNSSPASACRWAWGWCAYWGEIRPLMKAYLDTNPK